MKYNEPRKKLQYYGTRTKWQNLGKEPLELKQKYIDLLRLQKDLSKLKKVLGQQLFFEWMYHTGIISWNEYKSVRTEVKNPNETEIDYSKLVDITTDEAKVR